MEVAVAIGACVTIPILYVVLRPKFKTKVNCWFCNVDSYVEYANRNSFFCPSCEQYNGFNKDGDYNRRIPEQSYRTPTRFCVPAPARRKRTDLLNNLNLSPKQENGLCSDCNRNQEIIMNKTRTFEPIDESKWNEELEDYRYKLERMYQLCPRCTLAVHGKIEEDKKRYSYLFEFHSKVKRSIGSAINELINPNVKKSRRFFFAGGKLCVTLQLFTFLVSSTFCLANIHFLEEDADLNLLNLPKRVEYLLSQMYSSSIAVFCLIFVMHLTACYNNKCRTTFADLLLPFFVFISLLTFLCDNEEFEKDLALARCAFSSCIALLASASTFIPRKKLHRKRVNKIISSAFSVASTPISQCSSQDSRNASLLDQSSLSFRGKTSPNGHTPSPLMQKQRQPFENHLKNISNEPEHTRQMRWRERAKSVEVETEKENLEAMDWDDNETEISHHVAKPVFRPSILNQASNQRSMQERREWTPARELAPSVASMSLLSDNNGFISPARTARPLTMTSPSVFSKRNVNSISPARSIFQPRSVAGSYAMKAYPEAHTRTGSVFTSISQQDENSVVGSIWLYRVIIIMFVLIFLVLSFQIVVFYMLFRK